MLRVPSSVIVVRPIKLNGEVLPTGTSLTAEQVDALGFSLNTLLDAGIILATPDAWYRRPLNVPRPNSLPPTIRNAMVESITPPEPIDPMTASASRDGLTVTVTIENGVGPFVLNGDWGADEETSKRSVTFTDVPNRPHNVTVTDSSDGTVVIAPVPVEQPAEKLSVSAAAVSGSVMVQITGGFPPYEVELIADSGYIVDSITTSDTQAQLTGATSGMVNVTDRDGTRRTTRVQ